jgi:zinc and cadmium transporter
MVASEIWLYSLVSVLIVSLISLIGLISLSVKIEKLRKILIYVISFSAGALLGDAFIHLLPETVSKYGFGLDISLYLLLGIGLFFFLEKVIHWNHCHGNVLEDHHEHAFAYMNLVGDGFHNFLDGVIIAVSYLVNPAVGVATTIAVALHEIPQEIGDFGVLIHGGFSKSKALLLNFGTACFAFLGVIVVLLLEGSIEGLEKILIPVAAGGFVYIAGSDLIPELHRHSQSFGKSLLQILAFLVGIGVMVLLLFI